MKKMIFMLLVTSVLFAACGSSEEKSDKKSESKEPNDKIEEANTVKLDDEFSMAIFPEGDVDWYKVEIPEQGYLLALTKDFPSDLDVQVRFAQYDEWGSKKEVFLTSFEETPATYHVIEKGNYYIMVGDRWGKNSTEEEFKIKFEFIEEFDEFEPNNKIEDAIALSLDSEYSAAIFPIGDVDWFMFEVTEPGYIYVKAKDVPDDIQLSATFATYDEYGSKKTNIIRKKEQVPVAAAVSELGQYYIELSTLWDNKESRELFTWNAEFVPEMDMYEPNNKYEEATEIAVNDTLMLAIFPVGDKDFFKISPEQTGKLKLLAGKQGNIQLRVKFFQLDENNKLKEIQRETDFPAEIEITDTDNDIYLEFYDQWNKNASLDLIEIILSME